MLTLLSEAEERAFRESHGSSDVDSCHPSRLDGVLAALKVFARDINRLPWSDPRSRVHRISPILARSVYEGNIRFMLNWAQVKGFDWDIGNARKSADKHSVSQAEAEQVFFNEPLLLAPDSKHSVHEQRYHALGRTDEGRLLHITFTLRVSGTLIRVISARNMHRKERIFYEQTP